MNLPGYRTTENQLRLFPAPRLITSVGQTRGAVGEFFEIVTAAVSGARRLRNDCRADICPDLRYDEKTFFECKGVGKTGKAIFYAGRMSRYSDFANAGNEIPHWIWAHNWRASASPTVDDLFSALGRHTRELFIVDFRDLAALCVGPSVRINNQYNARHKGAGYGSNVEYGNGWVIPLPSIREHCYRRSGVFAAERFGMAGVSVFVSRSQFGEYL